VQKPKFTYKSICHLKKSFKFGVSLIPHGLSTRGIRSSDRIFLTMMATASLTGVYMISVQVASVILLAMNAINLTWTPYLYKNLKSKNYKNIVIGIYLVLIASIVFITISIFSIDLIFYYMIDPAYSEAKEYTLYIMIAYGFIAPYVLVVDILTYLDKNWLLSKISFFNLSLYVVLLIILFKQFGPIGIAYATIISYAATAFLVLYLVNIHIKLPWLLRD